VHSGRIERRREKGKGRRTREKERERERGGGTREIDERRRKDERRRDNGWIDAEREMQMARSAFLSRR